MSAKLSECEIMTARSVLSVIKWSVISLFLGVVWSNAVFAEDSELVIEITSGVDQQTKIAVVPFQWGGIGLLPESVDEIVSADLYRTGQFRPLSRESMLNRPVKKENIVFGDWRLIGVEYIVIGRLTASVDAPNQIRYWFGLYDVRTERELISAEGSAGDLRDLAHHISDQVYEFLTGIPGAFSTQILYITVERLAGDASLYRLRRADADGHRVVTLFESKQPILSPAWSPDGHKVSYVSYHKDERPTIFVQDIKTGHQKQVTNFKGLNGAPDWSPDGNSLVLTLSLDGNPEIYRLNLKTGKYQRLTHHFAIDTEARWLPDGSGIIFTSDRGGSPQIYKMILSTGDIERLTYEGQYNARGSLSADGRFLAMVHRRKGVFHIAVQDLEYGYLRILTETTLDESPSIAPNGSMLIYATYEKGKELISAVSLDGKVKVRLPARTGAVREPVWSPQLVGKSFD